MTGKKVASELVGLSSSSFSVLTNYVTNNVLILLINIVFQPSLSLFYIHKLPFKMCRFTILFCFILATVKADFWCSDKTMESLLTCRMGTNIQPVKPFTFNMVKLKSRMKCAKKADCTRRPWDFNNVNIQQARNYSKCMKKINPEEDVLVDLMKFEYRCRKELAEPYKDQQIYLSLLPPEGTPTLTFSGITL